MIYEWWKVSWKKVSILKFYRIIIATSISKGTSGSMFNIVRIARLIGLE